MNSIEKPSLTGILRAKPVGTVDSTADGYLRYFDGSQQAADDDVTAGREEEAEVERRRKDAQVIDVKKVVEKNT